MYYVLSALLTYKNCHNSSSTWQFWNLSLHFCVPLLLVERNNVQIEWWFLRLYVPAPTTTSVVKLLQIVHAGQTNLKNKSRDDAYTHSEWSCLLEKKSEYLKTTSRYDAPREFSVRLPDVAINIGWLLPLEKCNNCAFHGIFGTHSGPPCVGGGSCNPCS